MCSLTLANFWSCKGEHLGWLFRTISALLGFQKRLLSRSHKKCLKGVGGGTCPWYITDTHAFPLVSTNNTQKCDNANIARSFGVLHSSQESSERENPTILSAGGWESSLTIPISFIYLTLKTFSYPAGVEDKREEEEERSKAMERKSQNTKQNPVPEDCFQKCTAGLQGVCNLTCLSSIGLSKKTWANFGRPCCFTSYINSLYLLLSASI